MRAPLLVEVDGSDRAAAGIRFDAMHVGVGTNLAPAGALRHSNDGGERTGFGAHLAAEAQTEATIDASASSRSRLRKYRHGCREWMPAKLARGPLENYAGRFHRQWRHRIRLRPRWIERAGICQSGNTDFPFHFSIVRFQIRVRDRPIHEAGAGDRAGLGAFDEIDFVKTPEIGREVNAGPADPSTRKQCE